MEITSIIENLRKKGVRITQTRRAVIGIILASEKPLTAGNIIRYPELKELRTNKTTVYRELTFLENEGVIRKVRLADNEIRYEYSLTQHHHHTFCVRCKEIGDVRLNPEICKKAEISSRKAGFELLGHSIEMFGICAKCKNKKI